MRDPFSYSARWDSIGLGCAFCKHQSKTQWPNESRDYSCELHSISLAVQLAKNGFIEGEWFCSSFTNDGNADSRALIEFESIQPKMELNVLYGAYGEDKKLKEIPFDELN